MARIAEDMEAVMVDMAAGTVDTAAATALATTEGMVEGMVVMAEDMVADMVVDTAEGMAVWVQVVMGATVWVGWVPEAFEAIDPDCMLHYDTTSTSLKCTPLVLSAVHRADESTPYSLVQRLPTHDPSQFVVAVVNGVFAMPTRLFPVSNTV